MAQNTDLNYTVQCTTMLFNSARPLDLTKKGSRHFHTKDVVGSQYIQLFKTMLAPIYFLFSIFLCMYFNYIYVFIRGLSFFLHDLVFSLGSTKQYVVEVWKQIQYNDILVPFQHHSLRIWVGFPILRLSAWLFQAGCQTYLLHKRKIAGGLPLYYC